MALSRRRPSQLASYGRRWWIQQHHLTSGPRRRMREVGGVTASGTSLVRANWRFGERYTTARSEGDERFSVAIENTPSFPAVMHGVCPSVAWLLPLLLCGDVEGVFILTSRKRNFMLILTLSPWICLGRYANIDEFSHMVPHCLQNTPQ